MCTLILQFVQPFEQITTLTDVAEGTVVRVITRLDETCREVRDAARVIGDAELFKKMEEAQNKIKRDSEYKLIIRVTPIALTGCCLSCVCGQFVLLKGPGHVCPFGGNDRRKLGWQLNTHRDRVRAHMMTEKS